MGRKFYRTVFSIEVLSEERVPDTTLDEIYEEITNGDYSGGGLERVEQEVDGPAMAKLLIAQGSDPEFFRLDENGKDLEDEEPIDPAIRRQMEGYEHDDN